MCLSSIKNLIRNEILEWYHFILIMQKKKIKYKQNSLRFFFFKSPQVSKLQKKKKVKKNKD